MNKLLVICGPTAVGKTSLAIKLSKKFNGEIISADSRQVFRGLNIGTGKDIEKETKIKYPWFSKYGYYEIDKIKVWGYDIVEANSDFSVSAYVKFANKIIYDITKRGKLPILVGGTGLYIKGVIDGFNTISIPRNNELRANLEKRNADELFEHLAQMDSVRAGNMNASDRKNPRRLIRAIEVATWKLNHGRESKVLPSNEMDVLIIGLNAPKKFLEKRIVRRVEDRIKDGIEKEIKELIKKRVSWQHQSMSSMGYRQWREYFEGKEDRETAIKKWQSEELRYVKRQIIWWQKDRRVSWFDVSKTGFLEKVENLIKKWQNKDYNA